LLLIRALPFATVLALLATTPALAAAADVVPGEVVVRFAPDTSSSMRAQALDTVEADGSTATPLPGTRLITLPDDADVQAAAAKLERRPDVLWAEPNYVVETAMVPDDPNLYYQWGLVNDGQVVPQQLGSFSAAPVDQAGVAGIDDGGLPEVWDRTTGRGVRVGVVDTGIAPNIDLDPNVDRALSRDFVSDRERPFADGNGHGTKVAGVIAAVGNNGRGMAGVAWDARVVALRAIDYSGSGSTLAIAAAFTYAGRAGLPIVNASLAFTEDSQALRDAIASAPDTLFVVAAGNSAQDVDARPWYPCALPNANIVCVGSIDNDGAPSFFTNVGVVGVDLAAPGNEIVGTSPTFDDVDVPLDAGWAHSGTGDGWVFADGAWTTPITPGMDAVLAVPGTFDLAGRDGCTASITWGGTWTGAAVAMTLERRVANVWKPVERAYPGAVEDVVDLNADDAADVALRVRVAARADAAPAQATVENLLQGCVVPDGPGGLDFATGTSLAAPQVAGAAALLEAARPDLTTAQLRAALLSSTTPSPALAPLTATGGRLNVAAALAAVTPTPTPDPVPQPAVAPATTTVPLPAPPAPLPEAPLPAPAAPPTASRMPEPAAPRATVSLPDARQLTRTGTLIVRTTVSANATVKATATLRWRGGHLTLTAPARRGLKAGDQATLRLRATPRQRQALRSVGRIRARIVLLITGDDGRTRQVVRQLTIG
jgi:subtilisin family serine protease